MKGSILVNPKTRLDVDLDAPSLRDVIALALRRRRERGVRAVEPPAPTTSRPNRMA